MQLFVFICIQNAHTDTSILYFKKLFFRNQFQDIKMDKGCEKSKIKSTQLPSLPSIGESKKLKTIFTRSVSTYFQFLMNFFFPNFNYKMF